MRIRFLILPSLVMVMALSARAVDPFLGYVYPSVVQCGTTNRLVIGGQNFWNGASVWVDGDGVRVTGVENVPGFPVPDMTQRKYLQNWLDLLAKGSNIVLTPPSVKPTEAWRTNRWWSSLDRLDARARAIVEKDLWVRRNPLQAAPALRQLLLVTVVVAPEAKLGRRHVRVLRPDGISAPHCLDVVASPVVEEPLYSPPSRKVRKPEVKAFPAVLAGQILPGETDEFRLWIEKGQNLHVSVIGRALQPFVGDAVPGYFNPVVRLVGPDGDEVAFADDRSGFDPDPDFTFSAPRSGFYRLEIFDRLYRGREDFVYSVSLEDACGYSRPVGSSEGGRFVRHVTVNEPGPRAFEVFARRIGSKMDARMKLFDSFGRLLAQWDDVTNAVHVGTMIQDELDPKGTYDFKIPGDYLLEVEDACGRSDADVFCRIDIRRPGPHFRIMSDRSGFCLSAGQWQPMKVFVERLDGFDGPITLVENEWLRFNRPIIPAGTNEWTVSAIGKCNQRGLGPLNCEILAVGTAGEDVCATRVMPCDAAEQAFAWQHLVPAPSFVYRCRFVPQKKKADGGKRGNKK